MRRNSYVHVDMVSNVVPVIVSFAYHVYDSRIGENVAQIELSV